jgi:predicted metal-dependent hydrolase
MKNTIIFTITLVLLYIFIFINKTSLKYVESSLTGVKYLVKNNKDKKKSAELLEMLILRMYKLRNHLVKNIKNYPDMKKYIKLLKKNFTKSRTTIYENSNQSDLTSYSVNKGEEIVFCLKSRKTNKNHEIDLLMYVAVHELGHLACPEIGHTPLFNRIFKFLLEEAIKLDLYKVTKYSETPTEYCGMVITSNILY